MRKKLLFAALLLVLALVVYSVFFRHSESRVSTFEFDGQTYSIVTLLVPSLELYRPEPFSEGMSHVRRVYVPGQSPNGSVGISTLRHTNSTGTLAVVPILTPALTPTRSGFVNSRGEIVIPLEYDDALCFSEGLAAVRMGGQWGFIDMYGNVVIPFEFGSVSSFREGLAQVERDGMWYFIDHGGNEVLSLGSLPQSRWMPRAWGFHEGLAAVQGIGYIDREGNVVIPQSGGPFAEGFAMLDSVGRSAVIDREGNRIDVPGFHFMSSFSEGLAVGHSAPPGVSPHRRWAFVDTTGNIVISLSGSYHRVYSFSNGLAAVIRIRTPRRPLPGPPPSPIQVGFIDRDGELVIPLIYNGIDNQHHPFSGGVAAVALGSRWRYIDRMGNVVLVDNEMPDFDSARSFSEDLAWVRNGDRWGIVQLVPVN